ncbi:hypothetical protein LE181_02030 [Streptomyces sp. SCA3-4]|uniref:VG15 protein n=1 Tax=Streptomyces sichuanensis TaxID=2871810 RepID=UPI001CE27A36|nr:hypothetical protein [Streptomyces sichuanensis]MCA6090953.1 hypothetical protein [Streptomyces sichuanensis]
MKILRALADAHRRRQEALSRVLRTEYLTAWARHQAVTPDPESERAWSATVGRIVHTYGLASASLAADYYDEARRAADVKGSFTATVAAPPPVAQITAARSAVRRTAASRPRDEDGAEAVEAWRRTQQERDLAAVQRLAAQAGRRTIEQATRADPEAVGWVRVTGGNCCAFCALLAIRGLLYGDRKRAVSTSSGDPYHDRCACSAEPVFRGRASEDEPQVAEWEELYYDASHGVYGTEKLRAFRRAFDAKYGRGRGPGQAA